MPDQMPYAYGAPVSLQPGLSMIVAPNPSPMTFWGTNTYLLGERAVAVIDPGPADDAHLEAILRATADHGVSHVLLTHSHLDHSPLARPLAEATGAQISAFGPSSAGRSPVMTLLMESGLIGGGEGIDPDFAPDVALSDGALIEGDGWTLTAHHTPGHIGNHMCFAWDDVIFTGDHVMGWSTSLISPPDGDLTDFMASCAKLAAMPARAYYPGHGPKVDNPMQRLDWLIAHRKTREAQVLSALDHGSATPEALTLSIYDDIPARLHPVAERNVLAHLIDLYQRGEVTAPHGLSATGQFERLSRQGSPSERK